MDVLLILLSLYANWYIANVLFGYHKLYADEWRLIEELRDLSDLDLEYENENETVVISKRTKK